MIKLVFGCLFFLSACGSHTNTGVPTEKKLLEIAHRHIFEVENIPYAEHHLQIARNEYNSAEASVLLARLEIGKAQKKYLETSAPKNWNTKVIEYTEPFVSSNGDAAFLYGLAYENLNFEKSLNGFLMSARFNNPNAMLYASSLYQWDLQDSAKAYDYLKKAAYHGCAIAAQHLNQIEKNEFWSPRGIELLNLGVDAKGISALLKKAGYVEDLSSEEALYLRHIANREKEAQAKRDAIAIYDMNFACR